MGALPLNLPRRSPLPTMSLMGIVTGLGIAGSAIAIKVVHNSPLTKQLRKHAERAYKRVTSLDNKYKYWVRDEDVKTGGEPDTRSSAERQQEDYRDGPSQDHDTQSSRQGRLSLPRR